MQKAKQHIQSKYIRNASICLKWNDMRIADMKELGDILLGGWSLEKSI